MSRSILQFTTFELNPGSPTSTTAAATFANATQPGSSFYLAWTYGANAAAVESVSDTQNGAWGPVFTEHAIDTTNSTLVGHARIDNTIGGAAPTVTLTLGTTETYRGLLLIEVSGTTGTTDGLLHTGQFLSAPGAQADAVSSGQLSTSPQNDGLLISVGMNTEFNNIPNAGTGFTSGGTMWAFEFPPGFARWEYKQVSAQTPLLAGTFTRTAAFGHDCVMCVFTENGNAANAISFASGTTA